MNQSLWHRILEILKRKLWSKRWQRAVTCLAAVAVFGTTYALILPAITMTGDHPTLAAEQQVAWSGDELTVKVTAGAELFGGEKTFVLTSAGEEADLSSSYVFDEEGICVITDDEGNEIELHRSIQKESADVLPEAADQKKPEEVYYWFTLDAGRKTEFTLQFIDEKDETRFAEMVEAVKQSAGDVPVASVSDAVKTEQKTEKASTASASNAVKATGSNATASNADVIEANALAAEGEEKIQVETDDDGFTELMDGNVINDIQQEVEEEQTRIVAELMVSAGSGKDYAEAIADAEKNADKRGDAQVKLQWEDATVTAAAETRLSAFVNGASIAVFCDEKAGIPADAVLSVEEIEEGTEEYAAYLAEAKNSVSNGAQKSVTHARFFDITILDAAGNEIQPQAPVKVVIGYDSAIEAKKDEGGLDVVHFSAETPEVLTTRSLESSSETEIDALSFTADSFSVYAVLYTVDFTFELEGSSYKFSMDGGAGISMREMLEKLHVNGGYLTEEELQAGISDVAFSNEEYVRAIKAEQDTTVGKLAEENEIILSFDGSLSEEEKQEIRDKAIQAGDWGIYSLSSFETEEQLTITMNNGEQFFVMVTDPPAEGEQEGDYPRSGDGSNIEAISAKWITEDTVDNADASFLYVRPTKNEDQSVRLQINYALSGEHSYKPGDVTITVPTHIFKNRDGQDYGVMTIPFPEDPSTKNDFNWKLIDGNYVLTNTKTMSAATKGYIQFAIGEMAPHDLVDMAVSAPFDAYIEVTTHRGNTLALRSNALTAQFDTEARVTSVSKRVSGSPTRVSADQIPASQRVAGETEYVKVNWYMWGVTKANTEYVLDMIDEIPQASVVRTLEDGTQVTESDIHGFVINNKNDKLSEDGTKLERDGVFNGWKDGDTSYYSFSTAYPASQFQPDVKYTFHNKVTFRVTEKDPDAEVTNPNVNGGVDPQLVTETSSSAQTTWSFSAPEWKNPTGHFMVCKNGNDDVENDNTTHKIRYGSLVDSSDLHIWHYHASNIDGWYGIYPSAINDLQDAYAASQTDGSIRLAYTIDSIGYVMPWMFDEKTFDEQGKIASRLSKNYKLPVTMTTEDTGVCIGRNTELLTPLEDYTYVSLQFPKDPWIYTGVPHNINPDGSWAAKTAEDGTFLYERNYKVTDWPDITVQLQRNGEWEDYAVASWKTGSFQLTFADGSTQTRNLFDVPADTENFRTVVTLQNTSKDEQKNQCLQAALDYDVRVVIKLKSTEAMMELVRQAFAESNRPEMFVYNNVNLSAVDSDNKEIVSIDKDGYDSIRGYTTETAVYPHKTSEQKIADIDFEKRIVTIHYSADVEERSVINDEKTYEQAVADKRLDTETHGVWRDLLPKGVTPVLGTVRLRDGDSITRVETIENYKDSGRTLLIVEADLTPQTEQYKAGDIYYYQDVPAISFDAVYSFEALIDYGENLHNVISFESSRDHIGSVENYCGEPDDPYSSNNIATQRAFADNTERDLMKDLNPDRDDPSFVYAGTDLKLDIIAAARTSLSKEVMVNNDGWWSDGLYYTDPEGNKRTVYEGGVYSYRLRTMSDDQTISKDLIIYDALETYWAVDGNDQIDIDSPHWQGKFMGVDVSQLEAHDCDPVIYYSTINNLQLSDENDPKKANTVNMNLEDDSIWVKADEYTGDLADVKAIAIDARKKTDGTDFVLEPLESATVIVNMRAPHGQEATDYIAQKGVWGDSAHAYNNVYLLCTSIDKTTMQQDGENFVRKDYTKVGLMQFHYDVKKIWDDVDNRDGIRPKSVKVHLLADGVDTGRTLDLPIVIKDPETGEPTNLWEGSFKDIPYTDPDGNKIQYSIKEDVPEGYTAVLTSSTGDSAVITNRHTPEYTTVSGTKTWTYDNEDLRPESIQVQLYADGKLERTTTVKPDAEGKWNYSFEKLYKNRNGQEIVYTVKEVLTGKGQSYIATIEKDPNAETTVFNIVNKYHPHGDLLVSKKVAGGTDATADKEFTFNFEFLTETQGVDDSGEITTETAPSLNEYEYEIRDEDGNVIAPADGEKLTVGNNGSVTIKGGQQIYVKELEEGIRYIVTEERTPGFRMTSTGENGKIVPNIVNKAEFVNTYIAGGEFSLKARKVLYSKELLKNQFRFELYEVTEGTDASGAAGETETLIRTASNDKPASPVLRPDGTIDYSEAPVTFGAITYSNKDIGKTYTYRVKETKLDKPEYIYSETIYTAKVTVIDNGDGTLSTQTKYYKTDDNGNLVEVTEEEALSPVVFENTYKAEGSIPLLAWKSMEGRDLKQGEFTFNLLNQAGTVVATVTNNADGTVKFNPEGKDGKLGTRDDIAALKFTEKDAGKTLYFAVHEKPGSDPAVNYDSTFYGYTVKIEDNGDGTLNITQGVATPQLTEVECNVCHGDMYSLGELTDISFSANTRAFIDGIYQLDPSTCPPALRSVYAWMRDHGEMKYQQFNWDSSKQHLYHIFCTSADAEFLDLFDAYLNYRYGPYSSYGHLPEIIRKNGGIFIYDNEDQSYSPHIYYGTYCSECGGTGKVHKVVGWTDGAENMPVFTNTTGKGGLAVTKRITNDSTGFDPNQEFRFNVTLIGKNIGKSSPAIETTGYTPEDPVIVVPTTTEFYTPPETLPEEGATVVETGVQSGCTWELYSDGTLLIKPTNGVSGGLGNISTAGNAPNNFTRGSEPSWYGVRQDVNYLVIADGVQAGIALQGAFGGLPNLVYADIRNLDTSTCTSNMVSIFAGDSSLEKIDFGPKFVVTQLRGGEDRQTGIRSWVSYMFTGCSSLQTIDLTYFELSAIYGTNNYSGGGLQTCSSLERIILPSTWRFRTSYNAYAGGAASNSQFAIPPAELEDGRKTTGKWVREDGTYGPYTPAELAEAYNENPEALSGVWVWDYKGDPRYTVAFDANDGGGSMRNQKILCGTETALNPSIFYRFGYTFSGWNTAADGTGTTYADKATVLDLAAEDEKITLYAQWTKDKVSEDTSTLSQTFILHDGETMTLKDIPAGTTYQVWEETPDGWTLVEQKEVSGTIEPLITKQAEFSNRYTPGDSVVQFNGIKTLDGEPADRAFTFVLKEGEDPETGTVRQTVTNSNGGRIEFRPITYKAEDAGVHHYTITETPGGDSSIEYDSHVEYITVTVTVDEEGKVKAEKSISDNGVAFENTTIERFFYGDLSIYKNGSPLTDENKNDEFTFQIMLTTSNGIPYDGEVAWLRRAASGSTEGETVTGTETPSSGVITLTCKAGEMLRLKDLPIGTKYAIEETNLPQGWILNVNNSDETSGSIVVGDTKVVLKNEYSAKGEVVLEAHKRLAGTLPQDGQFTFELLDRDGNMIERVTNGVPDTTAEYLDDDGNLVQNPWINTAPVKFSPISYVLNAEKSDTGEHIYTIREVVPKENAEGYDVHQEQVTVTVVHDAEKKVLTATAQYDGDGALFTNTPLPADLKISKEIVLETQDEGLIKKAQETEFSFTVRLYDGEGKELEGINFTTEKYQENAEAPTETGTVASGGRIVLKGGEYVLITGLPVGTTYKTEEVLTDEQKLSWTDEASGTEGTISAEGQAHAAFKNTYRPTFIDITLHKVSDVKKPLGGAVFELYKMKGETPEKMTKSEFSWLDENAQFVIGEEGFTMTYLTDGTYQLKEVKAPEHYIITNATPVTFTVTNGIVDEGSNQLTEGVSYTPAQGDENDAYTIPNDSGRQLPESGGPGTLLYTLGGMMLLIGSAWMYGFSRRRGERRFN